MTSTVALPQQIISYPANFSTYVPSAGTVPCAVPSGNYFYPGAATSVKPQTTSGNLLSLPQQDVSAGGSSYSE